MEPIIRIRQLNKQYGDKEVLKGINLEIWPGQIIGYIGTNGAGKSDHGKNTYRYHTGLYR